MRQTRLPVNWISDAEECSSSFSSSEEEKEPRRNAKPLQWTRVKSLEQMRNQKLMVYDAMEDMRFDRNLKTIRKEIAQPRGQFVFDPEDFKEDAKSFTVEAYKLPEEGLLEYAR